jgi:hypothetical protein
MLALEDPIVSLISNLPTHEHSEKAMALPFCPVVIIFHHSGKVRSYVLKVSVKLKDIQPIFGFHPKPTGEATLHKEVINRLRTLLT